jgi:hypothetical protein
MPVQLLREYLGHLANTVQRYPAEEETALINSRAALNSAAVVTAGAQVANRRQGYCAIPAGQSSVVVTCPFVDPGSIVHATVSQAAADTTLTTLRVVASAGTFTVFGNANATAAVQIAWSIAD